MQRHVAFDRLFSFRDVGGYATADGGTVAYGRLYRSDSLGKLDGDDWARFLDLGVRTVVDLRYDWEIAAAGRVPEAAGLAYRNLCVEHRPYDQAALGASVDPVAYLGDRYAEVAEDGAAEIAEALRVIAYEPAPVVVHCASGKDRTGLVVGLALHLVGVSDDDVVADFALTNLATGRILAAYRDANDGRTPPWPHYGAAPAGVLRRALADLAARYGSVRGYAVDRLGLSEDVLRDLRARLVS